MLEGFIDLVKSLFPCVDVVDQEKAKEAIKQFYIWREKFDCFCNSPEKELSQGDILSQVPFKYYDEDGNERSANLDAMILSVSCDIDNDNNILLAPVLPIEEIGVDRTVVESNCIYHLVFFPDEKYFGSVIDLSLINTFPKNQINDALEKNRVNRKFSLNILGYYLLLCKIAVHLLRPEDSETLAYRSTNR